MSKRDYWSLKWLSDHPGSWGAHIARGEEPNDPDMRRWIRDGLIQINEDRTGYEVTDKWRRLQEPQR